MGGGHRPHDLDSRTRFTICEWCHERLDVRKARVDTDKGAAREKVLRWFREQGEVWISRDELRQSGLGRTAEKRASELAVLGRLEERRLMVKRPGRSRRQLDGIDWRLAPGIEGGAQERLLL